MDFGERIAGEYGFTLLPVDLDDSLRGCVSVFNNIKVILINQNDRAERQNFTIAHEIGHYVHNHLNESEQTWQQEEEANSFAADLLLDPAELRGLAYEPLDDLKETFSHCSYEVIARQCLKHRDAVLTIFDNFHMTVRILSPLMNREGKIPLQDYEFETVKRCLKQRKRIHRRNNEMECWANYIEDPPGTKFRRVILFTEGRESFDG
ncbi:MAG: ImmA/IrrE family metallo-endopeptidase [Candidatus Marinimicrobia bacterium]|nr:ImmA/IrrE family metallo-endopeptidase [Candidatus Neomarinimicrobiota bacterium]